MKPNPVAEVERAPGVPSESGSLMKGADAAEVPGCVVERQPGFREIGSEVSSLQQRWAGLGSAAFVETLYQAVTAYGVVGAATAENPEEALRIGPLLLSGPEGTECCRQASVLLQLTTAFPVACSVYDPSASVGLLLQPLATAESFRRHGLGVLFLLMEDAGAGFSDVLTKILNGTATAKLICGSRHFIARTDRLLTVLAGNFPVKKRLGFSSVGDSVKDLDLPPGLLPLFSQGAIDSSTQGAAPRQWLRLKSLLKRRFGMELEVNGDVERALARVSDQERNAVLSRATTRLLSTVATTAKGATIVRVDEKFLSGAPAVFCGSRRTAPLKKSRQVDGGSQSRDDLQDWIRTHFRAQPDPLESSSCLVGKEELIRLGYFVLTDSVKVPEQQPAAEPGRARKNKQKTGKPAALNQEATIENTKHD